MFLLSDIKWETPWKKYTKSVEFGVAVDDLEIVVECLSLPGVRDEIIYLPL
jgi:hypothetical protein